MAKNKNNSIDSFAGIFGVVNDTSKDNNAAEIINNNDSNKNKSKGRPKSGREVKKRITFTIRPSVNNRASEVAYQMNKSLSEVVEELLIKYIDKHSK